MKLLLDEMYAPAIAASLRSQGHDVVSASERDDLRSLTDRALFDVMQGEARVIVTNNVLDFMPLAQLALQSSTTFYGVVFTSDRSLPRSRGNIGTFVGLLEALLIAHAATEALPARIAWLAPNPSGEATTRA